MEGNDSSSSSSSNNSKSIDSMKTAKLIQHLPMPIILGSGSFTRKLILQEIGIPFHVIKRPIDESAIGDRSKDTPYELVLQLAKAKSQHLVQEIRAGRCDDDLSKLQVQMSLSDSSREENPQSMIILTADQVVTWGGGAGGGFDGNGVDNNKPIILEKPSSIDEAKEFVQKYALSPPSTVGSCVLTHVPSGIQVSGVDTATIHFLPTIGDIAHDSGKDLVDLLLEQEAPILDCAGGLMIEHEFVQAHVERIEGTQDSVMGLSKALVERLLLELKQKLEEQNLL